jgi:hypothetical protein
MFFYLSESSSINENHGFVICNEEICDKLSNVYAGVTTIAGRKSTRSGDMHDPSDDA